MSKRLLLILSVAFFSLGASAQQYLLSGRVTDKNNKPIAFASVYIRNSTYGTAANEQGNYQLRLGPGNYVVVYRSAGFKEQAENISITDGDTRHSLQMTDEIYAMQKFARANGQTTDSAVNMIQQVISRREYLLKQVNSYSCAAYIKGVQKLVSSPKALMGQNVTSALSVDSSGRGILFQTESISDFSFQQPDKFKEVMVAHQTAGQNATFNYNKASDLSPNFYQNIFTVPGLSSHGYISPFASYAMNFYNYILAGSKVENGVIVHKIQVIPKRTNGPSFTGYVYITDGDWHIYGVDLMLTGNANSLNLVDTLQVRQQYVPITDSVWEPLSIHYQFKGAVLGFVFEGYYLGIYNNYKLNPSFPEHYFNGEIMRTDTIANSKEADYWQRARPVPLTAQENKDYENKASIAALKMAMEQSGAAQSGQNQFNILPYLVFGYKASFKQGRDSLYFDPFIQTIFYNTVEGAGINLRTTYTHYFDTLRFYKITPKITYGFADKQVNASLRGEYDYDPFNRGKFIGGIGSDLLDLNNEGTRSLYFNTLSTLLSEQNFVKYYRSEFINFGFQREIVSGILWNADLSYANRTQLFNNSFYSINTYVGRHLTSNNPQLPDAPATDRTILFPQNQALTFNTTFTFTFNQEYITRPTGREFLPSIYPQIKLNYRKGISGVFGSDVDYDFASLTVYQQHLETGLIGYSSFKIEAGNFFNRSKLYYMDYNHFIGNQGTTFDPTPGSFHFLPFYTYSTNGPFFEGHYEHNFSGHVFNRVPLLRRLKLDEIIGVNYLTTNNNRNYSEYYIGVQRFIFRVDYGVSFAGGHKYLQGFRIFYGIK